MIDGIFSEKRCKGENFFSKAFSSYFSNLFTLKVGNMDFFFVLKETVMWKCFEKLIYHVMYFEIFYFFHQKNVFSFYYHQEILIFFLNGVTDLSGLPCGTSPVMLANWTLIDPYSISSYSKMKTKFDVSFGQQNSDIATAIDRSRHFLSICCVLTHFGVFHEVLWCTA